MNDLKKQDSAIQLKEFFKQWPAFYYFVYDYLGPLYFGGLSANTFLKKFVSNKRCYNLGSGTRRISKKIINVDFNSYPEVDIVADIKDLPIDDNDADGIVCEEVLEHVLEPDVAVKEIFRILKKGGYAYITVPFLYPFHASPSDYTRWTHVGLKELFADFEIVEIGVRSGPFSLLSVSACYFSATLFSFGNTRLYWVLVYAFTFIFFPIKFLDIIGNRLPNSINMSALLYCVVKKK